MNTEKTISNSFSDILKKRRSIRSFAPEIPSESMIMSLFDAARWAPSSSNNQPWRYIYATQKEEAKFQKILDCLMEGNKIWAAKAPVLILSLAKNITNTGKAYRHNYYDTGAANLALAFQATALGMQAHIMGGFDMDKAKLLFELEPTLEPVVIIAIGFQGDIDALTEQQRTKETESERFELADLILK